MIELALSLVGVVVQGVLKLAATYPRTTSLAILTGISIVSAALILYLELRHRPNPSLETERVKDHL